MPTFVLAASLAACASLGGAPLGEVAELVIEGGTKPLREELRPARGTTRVLVLALDGLQHAELERAISGGNMPRLAALLGAPGGNDGLYEHAYSVPGVLTTLPSSTIAAWTSIFTGRPPAETGIPGNEWWSRREERLYAPAPISFRSNSHAIGVYTDGLLGELIAVPTLFELADVRSYAMMLQVHRGADLLQLAEMAQFGDLFQSALGASLSGGVGNPDVFRETDQTAVASLLSDLEGNGIPDLQVVYFAGIDLVTHYADRPLERQARYLSEVTDPLIGRVLDAYADADALEELYVIVVSDHGHTEVVGDAAHALGENSENDPAAALAGSGFRVRRTGLEDDGGGFQAVVTSQGALANVYLADRSSCVTAGSSCDWRLPPRFEEDVLTAARVLYEWGVDPGGSGGGGPLDLVLARQPVPIGEVTRPFEVYTPDGLVPVTEYLKANPRPDLQRLDERLRQLGVGPLGHRAGDIVLLTRWGTRQPIEDRYYFGPPGYSTLHGGATMEDSHVPLIIAHGRASGARLREWVRPIVGDAPYNLVVTPLVQRLLRGEAPPGSSH